MICSLLDFKILGMEKNFYIRIPGETYYSNPLIKDSVCFVFDLENKTIALNRRSLVNGEFVTKSKSFSISREWLKIIEDTLKGEERFFKDYLPKYDAADGQRFVHSVFSYGEATILFPDYLSNFGNQDIFKRYRYYPEADRVKFYSILRSLIYIAFKVTMHHHKDFPTSGKANGVIKTRGEKLSLE